MKTEVKLALATADNQLAQFMSLEVDTRVIPGLLEALMPLRQYLPVVAVIHEQVVTRLNTLPDGYEICGQPIAHLRP